MKHLFVFFGFTIFFLYGGFGVIPSGIATASETSQSQHNKRQMILMWQDERVFGNGYYRPYSRITVTDENGDILWTGKTDAQGSFRFLLPENSVNPAREHILLLTGVDQFGRPIEQNGVPDSLQAPLLPGLQATGKTTPSAEVLLVRNDGKILKKYQADGEGNYQIFNAPAGSMLRIEKDGQEMMVPFTEGILPEVYLESDAETEAEYSDTSKNDSRLHAAAPEETPSLFVLTFLSVVVAGSIGLALYFFLKRRRSDLSSF